MQLIFFIFFGVILVFGGAFVLLRTAKKPKVPKAYKHKVHDDEENSDGW
ncbi:hypothetical protein [Methylomarinum vadi]|nr:hypothetical protein [Methylomarinum vadi]